jgi:TonB family protein
MVRKLQLAGMFMLAVLSLSAAAAGQQAPIRVGGDIAPPRKLKDVRPVYPDAARAARITGVVILEVTIGPDGRVADARVLRSQPMLDQAAVDAVRQWEFQPLLLNGQPTSVLMTVTVNFSLDSSFEIALDRAKQYYAQGQFDEADRALAQARTTLAQERTAGGAVPAASAAPPVRIGGDVREPKKIRDVKPVYPPEALAAGVRGVVIIEAVIGTDGTVSDARILRSVPLLDQAALDAVRQWQFTTTYLNGVATPVIMTVTVNFSM